MIRIILMSVVALSLPSCRDVDPADVSGRWALSGSVVPGAGVSCTLSGTLDIVGTTEGFSGTANWMQRVVRGGVEEVQAATYDVVGGRSTTADEPVGPPVPGLITVYDVGQVSRAYLYAVELTSFLMWGPWECEGLEGNWFLRPTAEGDG